MRPQLLLCYHKVGPVAENGRWLNVEGATLAAHARHFTRRGWGFRTASQAPLRERGTIGFQFDDTYASALRHGREILDPFGITATFWVVPSLVGMTSVWDGDRAASLAGWDDLTSARDTGHEIGNHTLTHPHLPTLDPGAQMSEIFQARQLLGARGFPGGTVCYPYGEYDAGTLGAMLRLRCEAGFRLGKRPALPTDGLFQLPRIAVAYSDSVPKLLYKIWVRPRLGGRIIGGSSGS